MASSIQTYDVLVYHAAADGPIVERISRRLRVAGLRPRLLQWSAVPGASPKTELRFAASSSRLIARVIGPTGLDAWFCPDGPELPSATDLGGSPAITVLTPGCPIGPADIPPDLAGGEVIDFRVFSGANAGWRALNSSTHRHRRLDRQTLKWDTIRSYDRIAEKFTEQWFDHPPILALEKMLSLLPCRGLILDAGCGPGHHARFMVRRGHEVIGIDLSQGMLEIARKSVRSVSFAQMDVQALRFPPAAFDGVWCAGAAMHIPREEILGTLKGFRRVLKPTGVVGINLQIDRQSEVVEFGEDLRFFEYYRDKLEIARLLCAAGFDVIAEDYGETTRNTHELDLTLKWITLYATPRRAPRTVLGR